MDNNKSKVLLSLLAGAAAGVVAGLLLAPDSGKKSRESLLSSASKWGGDLDKVFRDGLGRLQEMSGRLGVFGGQGGSSQDATAGSSADDMFNDFASENSGSGSGRKAGDDSGAAGARANAGTSPS